MKRILALVALAAFVLLGLTASFKASNPVYTSGPQLPQHFGGAIQSSAKEIARNPFGLLAPPRAESSGFGLRWVHDAISWRTHRDGSAVDSTIVTVSNTDFSSDTTAAYPLERIAVPFDHVTAAQADTITALTFCIGGSSSAPSIDSVYVGAQVSMDGISWVALTTTGGPAGTFAADAFVTGKPPVSSAGVIESASSNQLCLDYNILMGTTGKYAWAGNGSTAPSDQHWFGWRYIRFICTWSLVDEADVLQAWVGHYTPVGAPGGY